MIYPCEDEEDNLEYNKIINYSSNVWTSQSGKAKAERENNNKKEEFT